MLTFSDKTGRNPSANITSKLESPPERRRSSTRLGIGVVSIDRKDVGG